MRRAKRPPSQDGILFDALSEPLHQVYKDMVLLEHGSVEDALEVLRNTNRVNAITARPIFYAMFAVLSPLLYHQLAKQRDLVGLAVASFRELRYLTLVIKLPTLSLKSMDDPRPLEFAQQLNGIVEFIQFFEQDNDDEANAGTGGGHDDVVRDIVNLAGQYRQVSADIERLEQQLQAPASDGSRAPTIGELEERQTRLEAEVERLVESIQGNLYPRSKQARKRVKHAQELCKADEKKLADLENITAQNEQLRDQLRNLVACLGDESNGFADVPPQSSIEARIQYRLRLLDNKLADAKEAERQASIALKHADMLNEKLEAALSWVRSETKNCREQREKLAQLEPQVAALKNEHNEIVLRNAERANEAEILTARLQELANAPEPLAPANPDDDGELAALQHRVVQLEEQCAYLEAQIDVAQRQYVEDSERFTKQSIKVRDLRAQVARQKELLAKEIAQVEITLKES